MWTEADVDSNNLWVVADVSLLFSLKEVDMNDISLQMDSLLRLP